MYLKSTGFMKMEMFLVDKLKISRTFFPKLKKKLVFSLTGFLLTRFWRIHENE